jgi:hypothetical protein
MWYTFNILVDCVTRLGTFVEVTRNLKKTANHTGGQNHGANITIWRNTEDEI